MTERTIAFSTFLKLLELDETKKATMLRGFLRGGGFNYWRPLQSLAQDIVAGKLTLEELSPRISQFAKGHQKKYNENALNKILLWKAKRSVNYKKRPSKFLAKLKNSGFIIKFEPEIAATLNGTDCLIHVWATNTPSLSEDTLSVGLHLFRQAAVANGLENWNYLIFDTIKDKIFSEFDILANSQQMLDNQILTLEKLWKNTNSPSSESSKIPQQEDQISPHVGI